MKIKVSVTKEVLERSKMCGIDPDKKSMTHNCAIALAIIELFPEATVETEYMLFFTRDFDSIYWFRNNHVSSFIEEFDSLSPEQRIWMQPFSFEIEVPEYVIEKIGLNQIYKVLSESKTLEHIN